MKIAKYIFYFLATIILASCNYSSPYLSNYSNDTTISDTHGNPKDSLALYFPSSLKNDTGTVKSAIYRIFLKFYSGELYCFEEPILFNFYRGYDEYRFLLDQSFSRPLLFSLCRKGNEVWLVTKALDKQPRFFDSSEIQFQPPNPIDVNGVESELTPESKSKKYWSATLTYNNTQHLTTQDWKEFELLLATCSFWSMNPLQEETGLVDGAAWILEGHLENKYWFVERLSPNDNFRKPGEYLIKKSGINDFIY